MQDNSGSSQEYFQSLEDCDLLNSFLREIGLSTPPFQEWRETAGEDVLDLNFELDENIVEPDDVLNNLDPESLIAQTNLYNSNAPSIQLTDVEVIDDPCDIPSLREILEADVNYPGRISLLPESHNWEGEYGFNIDFGTETSYEHYRYYAVCDKLYVLKNTPWIAKFTSRVAVPSGYRIRVTSVYLQHDQVHYDVHRCPDHAIEDFKNGVKASDHFIHCINDSVSYVRDIVTLRRSLIVPYKSPSIGQEHSFYVFKFLCLNSCPGGINGRPVKVVFALENSSGNVVGRRSFEVKVCSTTHWDCEADNGKKKKKLCLNKSKTSSESRKRKIVDSSSHMYADILKFVDCMKKRYKDTQENRQNEGPYHITVRNEEERNVILQAKSWYEFYASINALNSVASSSQTNPKKPKKPKG